MRIHVWIGQQTGNPSQEKQTKLTRFRGWLPSLLSQYKTENCYSVVASKFEMWRISSNLFLKKQIGKFYAWFTNRAPTPPHPHPIWTRGFENPAMFAFKQISTNFLYNQIGVWKGERGGGCEAAITPNTFGGHYRASHAEWLLQAETLLTLFKVDLMKASIQCSSLVWARDSTHSEITHSGPGLGGWCLEFFPF